MKIDWKKKFNGKIERNFLEWELAYWIDLYRVEQLCWYWFDFIRVDVISNLVWIWKTIYKYWNKLIINIRIQIMLNFEIRDVNTVVN